MEQAARLELPANTYRALEQIARLQGVTPLRLIEDWVQQYQQRERLHTLRQEYWELIDKDLKHILTPDEAKRLDSVCEAINTIEMQSEANQIWKQQAEAIDAQFDKLQQTLTALPERREDMAEQDKPFIAERVRYYLKDAHPGGATLTVLEDQIWRDEFAWNVPVQPDFEPARLFEYYETLADIEIALRDDEDLKVYLVTSPAKAELATQAA